MNFRHCRDIGPIPARPRAQAAVRDDGDKVSGGVLDDEMVAAQRGSVADRGRIV